ncbi:Ig-like domain-containing protein [Arthrobacter crystallopoietes]|uniref:Ig-like domain-containing protein n=1 Tax=Crystallibacter crystallopoietes TaxID=37928 RepID=UPI003D1D55CB
MTQRLPGSALGPVFSRDGWLLLAASTISRVYLGIVLSLMLIGLLPALFGWQTSVVQSGSMEPHISAGDAVVSAPFGDEDPVPLGGVVEFTSPAADPDGGSITKLHRIVADNPDGTYETAGDANTDPDSAPLERNRITGHARLLVPMIGLPALWLTTGNMASLGLWAAATLMAVLAAVYGLQPASPPPAGGARTEPPPETEARRTGRVRRRVRTAVVLALAAVLALLLFGLQAFSAAAFTSTTSNQQNTFATASDWTPPTVHIVEPDSSLKDTASIRAEAADGETGIRDVAIQYLPSGESSWTTLCTTGTAPYTCTWNTRTVADGSYSFRAIATDNAGHSAASDTVDLVVANNLLVVLADPGETVRGTTSLSTRLFNTGTTRYTVRVEYSLAGANKWSSICPSLSPPYTCSWNTASFANDYYDLRAVAMGGTTTYSALITDVLVDNQAPTVAMTDPGTPLTGTRTFAATASDAHSGIAQVTVQYARSGASTWNDLCTTTDLPYSCRFDTRSLADGTYSFRALATDAAGNTTTSAAAGNRIVDNTISSVSLEDPGAYLTGTVALSADANSTAGISNVRIQSAPAGTTNWSTLCTLNAAPLTCNWDTRTAVDGLYDFRAVLTDGSGKVTTSATVASRQVDNSPLRGLDIQTINGSATRGRLQAGDSITYTYSEQINPGSIVPGWTGSPLAVSLRLRDGNLLGLGNSGDTVDILRSGNTAINLGPVNLRQNYIKNRKTAIFNATMTASLVTVRGIPRTVITVTAGSAAAGSNNLRTVSSSSTMLWNPSASVTGVSGKPSSTAPVNETGPADPEF